LSANLNLFLPGICMVKHAAFCTNAKQSLEIPSDRKFQRNRVWSNPMAVQKSRVTPSRRGMRRAHDALSAKQLSTDPTTGEVHLRHHITADGFYRGKKVIQTKTSAVEED